MAYPKVTVYSQPGRIFCNRVKEFPSRQNVPFIEKDISKDQAVFKELTEDLGLMTTPVILVNGETLVGFDQTKLQELHGLSSN